MEAKIKAKEFGRRMFSVEGRSKPPCFLGEEWSSLPLKSVSTVNHDSKLFEFALPTDTTPLNLPVCACLLLKAPGIGEGGEDVVRPYTPVSDDLRTGSFDLLVKVYENGNASQFLNNLSVGSRVEFKHIPFNVKEQYPFAKESLVMLCGGTGITPMYQALQCLFREDGMDTDTKVTLLYANKTEDDILLKEELDQMQKSNPDRLQVTYLLDHPSAGWDGVEGRIDAGLIQKICPPPSEDQLVFVCGPPGMYDVLCGQRGEKDVTGVLKDLGYCSTVVKF